MFHKEESLAAIQQQKLYNKSGNHGVPDANLFNVTFLLVDFGQGFKLCPFANERQQNSNALVENTLFHKY